MSTAAFTAYESGTIDLYPNDDEIYAVGSNHSSSVAITFAHEAPDTLAGVNWIPVPTGEF